MAAENKLQVTRRRVLDVLLGGGCLALLGTIAYPIFRYLLPKKVTGPHLGSVRAAKKSDIAPNTGKVFPLRRISRFQRPVYALGLHGPVPDRSGAHLVCVSQRSL